MMRDALNCWQKEDMMRRFLIALVACSLYAGAALAQTPSGQACLRAFEDRNLNGTYEPDEPFITRDLGATLSNTEGLIVQTGLLDDSPRQSQGILCFTALAPGQYTINVSSAAFQPTTSPLFVVAVTEGGAPQVIDVGAQIINTAPLATQPIRETGFTPSQVERIAVSSVAALVVILLMALFGWILSALLIRRPQPSYAAYPPYGQAPTGQYPAYGPPPTGQYPPYAARPDTGRMPPVTPYPPQPPYAPPPYPGQAYGEQPPNPYAPPPAQDDDTGRHRSV